MPSVLIGDHRSFISLGDTFSTGRPKLRPMEAPRAIPRSVPGISNPQRAAPLETRCLTGFFFKSAEQFTRILRKLGHTPSGAKLSNKPGRVPRGTAGELLAFTQHNIGDADFGEVICHGTPGDAAAHDHDLCPVRKCPRALPQCLSMPSSTATRIAFLFLVGEPPKILVAGLGINHHEFSVLELG